MTPEIQSNPLSAPQRIVGAVPLLRTPTPLLMGIVNVTPDSFSDGGRYYDPAMAIQHGLALAAAGADILDLGGESTRPGALPVSGAEQCRRVLPVIQALHAALPELVLSIDTTRAEVAAAALAAGASLINDTSAGLDDPEMLPLAAASGAWLVLMHRQGTPATMQLNPQYHDAAAEVYAWLRLRAEAAQAAGIAAERIVLDPGIGFGKRLEHNLALLANLPHLVALGYPVLIGASRKRMLAQLCDSTAPPDQFSAASCAVTALAIAAGVQILRVHDVAENYQARAVASAWQRAATQAGAGR